MLQVPDRSIQTCVIRVPVTYKQNPYNPMQSENARLVNPGSFMAVMFFPVLVHFDVWQAPPVPTSRLPWKLLKAPRRTAGQRSTATRRSCSSTATTSTPTTTASSGLSTPSAASATWASTSSTVSWQCSSSTASSHTPPCLASSRTCSFASTCKISTGRSMAAILARTTMRAGSSRRSAHAAPLSCAFGADGHDAGLKMFSRSTQTRTEEQD